MDANGALKKYQAQEAARVNAYAKAAGANVPGKYASGGAVKPKGTNITIVIGKDNKPDPAAAMPKPAPVILPPPAPPQAGPGPGAGAPPTGMPPMGMKKGGSVKHPKMSPRQAYMKVYGVDPSVEPAGGWKKNSGPAIDDPGAFRAYELITGKPYSGARNLSGITKAFNDAGMDAETWEPFRAGGAVKRATGGRATKLPMTAGALSGPGREQKAASEAKREGRPARPTPRVKA